MALINYYETKNRHKENRHNAAGLQPDAEGDTKPQQASGYGCKPLYEPGFRLYREFSCISERKFRV